MNYILIILLLIISSSLFSISIENKIFEIKDNEIEISYELANNDSTDYVFLLSHWFMNGLSKPNSEYQLFPTNDFYINKIYFMPSRIRENNESFRYHIELRDYKLKELPTFVYLEPEMKLKIRLYIDKKVFDAFDLQDINYDLFIKMHYADKSEFSSYFNNKKFTPKSIDCNNSTEFVIKIYESFKVHYYPILATDSESFDLNLLNLFNDIIDVSFNQLDLDFKNE